MSRLDVEGLRFLDKGPIDLTVESGECVALMGASGAGKTLLLRAIADLDLHDGVACLDGREAESMPAPEWRRIVGLLPPESGWWADDVGAHFPSSFAGAADLGALGLDLEVMHYRVARLSTGERQRLALLRLLANHPRALLLDEPTAGLDADNAERVERRVALYQQESEAAVVWVSHDRAQARRIASRAFELEGGRLQSLPSP